MTRLMSRSVLAVAIATLFTAAPLAAQEPAEAQPEAAAAAAAQEGEAPQGEQQGEAQAQAQEGEAAAGEREEFAEEMTVTARKREESLQDVPFSMVAPDEETLRDRGVADLEGVAANVGGFTVQNLGPGQSQVAMRGISAGQVVRDQPGVKEQVGVYLDESVISLSLFTPDIDLFDMSRVEVLRGPQGTLFGSGSLSGTVRYITNQPEIGLSDGVGEFSLSAIDDGDVGGNAKVAVNVPLGDTAAMRVTAYYNAIAGYMDAVQPGLSVEEDVNSGDRTGARVSLRFQPSERLTITPRLFYQELDMDGWNRIDDYNILGNPFTTTRPAVDLGEREQFTQLEEGTTDEFLLTDVNVEYAFDSVTLTSITSYTDRDILVVRDATALSASVIGGTIPFSEPVYTIDAPLEDATTVEVLTEELRLSGQYGRTDWVAGIFYSDIERDYGQSVVADGFTAAAFANDPGLAAAVGLPFQGPHAAPDELFFSDLDYDFEQLALFGELTWAVTDRFDLTGGLRFYDFEEDRTQTFDGFFSDPGTNSGSTTADGFAPRLIASYQATDNTTLNAQVSQGFRLGGINDPLNLNLCSDEDKITFGGRESWEDETVWNYEVGSKSTFGGGRGSFNIAAFHMDIEDLQATVTAGTCSSRVIFNVPKAASTGIELEFAAAPTTAFDFSVSTSYIDAELKSTLTSTDQAGNTVVVAGIQDGNRLPTVPEFQAALAGNYRWEMSHNWVGYVNGTFQHIGSRFTQVGDQAAGFGTVNLLAFPGVIGGPLTQSTFTFDPELPSYEIINLRLGFLHEQWDAALFVNNVTDERALLALDQERGTLARVGYLTNQPRTFGVNTRVRF